MDPDAKKAVLRMIPYGIYVMTAKGSDGAIAAEAAFRAGELSRAGGDGAAATASFLEAWARGAGTPFRGRAAIALGRLVREDDPAAALGHFEQAVLDLDTPRGVRDEATLWYARTQGDLGRAADSRRLLERVARTALDPVDQSLDRVDRLRAREGRRGSEPEPEWASNSDSSRYTCRAEG